MAADKPITTTFLLAQLGAHATNRFADRVGELGLQPPQVGVLRMIDGEPGLSQQALAEKLGILPSRIVAIVDSLEQARLVERRRHPSDRRIYALHLTEAGHERLGQVREVVDAHDRDLLAVLSATERQQLGALLGKVVHANGLTPGVHPGFRYLSGRA